MCGTNKKKKTAEKEANVHDDGLKFSGTHHDQLISPRGPNKQWDGIFTICAFLFACLPACPEARVHKVLSQGAKRWVGANALAAICATSFAEQERLQYKKKGRGELA